MPTNIPTGHALARKVYSAALFAAQIRRPSFVNMNAGPAPKQSDAEAKLKQQSAAEMPFVRITDLSKSRGDKVSVDLFNILSAKPIMGSRTAEGKGVALSSASMDIGIDQYRFPISAGDTMSRQRTMWDLRGIALATGWDLIRRYDDQTSLVHLAGARGEQNTLDWVVPLSSDPDFASIMVNTVQAPTYNRSWVANGTAIKLAWSGGAGSLASITTADTFKLEHIDALYTQIMDGVVQLQPIMVADDPAAKDEPLYVMYVTERQWNSIQTNTSNAVWRTFLQNAWNRASYGSKHPLFKGEPGLWRNILIRKMSRAIRWSGGDVMKVNNTVNAEQNVTVASAITAGTYAVDRAILLGAQALGLAYGRAQNEDWFVGWSEKELDHGDKLEVVAKGMGGKAKIRFDLPTGSGGALETTDHGVITLDTVVTL